MVTLCSDYVRFYYGYVRFFLLRCSQFVLILCKSIRSCSDLALTEYSRLNDKYLKRDAETITK